MQIYFKFFSFILGLVISSTLWAAADGFLSDEKTFATVFHLRGDVSAKAKSGVVRKLKQGDAVLTGETIIASAASEAVLKTSDAGVVAVRPNTELLIQKYSAEGKSSDHQVLNLMSGSLRVISGWIGKVNPEQHKVITPGATIGIRGTDHEPYVLPAQGENAKFSQGTYDKVNRGQTFLDANGASIDIDKGRVGYARDSGTQGKRQRAMMTLLMPMLLDVAPDFYIGGSFDKELDQYSAEADELASKALASMGNSTEQVSKQASAALTAIEDPEIKQLAPVLEEIKPIPNKASEAAACNFQDIGLSWLANLDKAISKRNADAILQLFTVDVVVKATVLTSGQAKTFTFNRDEMVKSTLASVNILKNYQQRREANHVVLADGATNSDCSKLIVRSVAIEQGQMSERPFRFDAIEEYVLEKRDGIWQATTVTTQQK